MAEEVNENFTEKDVTYEEEVKIFQENMGLEYSEATIQANNLFGRNRLGRGIYTNYATVAKWFQRNDGVIIYGFLGQVHSEGSFRYFGWVSNAYTKSAGVWTYIEHQSRITKNPSNGYKAEFYSFGYYDSRNPYSKSDTFSLY